MRGRVRVGRGLGVEHELHESRAVAQVDEDQPAVVAAAVHPAGDARLRCRPARRSARRTTCRGSGSVAVACFTTAGSRAGSSGSRRRPTARAARRTPCSCSATSLRPPTIATYRAPIRSACLSWPLQRAPGELQLRREPGAARLARERERGRARRRSSAAPRTGRRARRRTALAGRQQHPLDARRPSPSRASAGRRAARSGRRSARRRRRPTARRAHRSRTRTPCACSSRGRARASGRARSASPASSSSCRTCAKCSASVGFEPVEQLRRVAHHLARRRGRSSRTRAAGSGRSGSRTSARQLFLVRAQVGGELLAVVGARLGRGRGWRAAAACP